MVEIALLAVISVVAGVVFGVLRHREPSPTAFWIGACGVVFGAGVCNVLIGEVPGMTLPGHALGTAYPALLLAGALVYSGRRAPAWLVPLGLAAGLLRALLGNAGLPGLSTGVGLAVEPTAIALAALLVLPRLRDDGPASPAQRALAPSLLALAGVVVWTLLAAAPGTRLPHALLRAWVIAVPLGLALQIAADGERTRRAFRRARNRLEQSVAERTAELSQSLTALRESEERYRTVSELSSDYSFAVRIRPDFSLDFEWVTHAMKEIIGYEVDELDGSRWLSLFPEADRRRVVEELQSVIAGERDSMQVRVITRSGEPRWLTFRFGQRGTEADGEIRLVGTGRDVTDLKRAEAERRRLDAIVRERRHVESLGMLAGGVAHDFNNVLTVIRGNAHLALDELDRDSPVRERLERIRAVSEYASELSEQMLTYSGKASLEPQPLELSQLVRDALDLMRASVAEKNVLDIELAEALPEVRGDATQLRQVLLNLVGNASEATFPEGGRIRVRTGVRTLRAGELDGAFPTSDATPGDYAFLEVVDTGGGIPDDVRARVFEPFFTTKPSGRGLGLAAVFGIVSAHRGVIQIESAAGRGTTFRVLFPALDVAAPPPAPPSAEAHAGRGHGTVLVVDDDAWVLELASEFLTRAGFEVRTAGDGSTAVEVLRADPGGVDAVVLDLVMPVMSGEQTLLALREIRPDLRVVLATGYDAETSIERLAACGGVRFVQKPYEPEELVGRVRDALEGAG